MRFRTVLLLTTLSVLAAALLTSAIVASTVLDRRGRAELVASLDRTAKVFADLQRYREELFRATNGVVAEEPRLKAVTASADISRETIHGVARELQSSAGSDLLLLLDPEGRVIADAVDESATGADLSSRELFRRALGDGDGGGVWIAEGRAYQMHGRPLRFGESTVAVVLTGYELGAEVAQTVFRQTGTSLIISLDDAPIAVSDFEGATPTSGELREALAALPASTTQPVEVSLGGVRYLATAQPFPGYSGARQLGVVLLRSLDAALAPSRRLAWILSIVFGLGLLGAMAVSWVVSRKVAKPIDSLAAFTARVGAGDLSAETTVRGPREIQTLGAAMNRMVAELRELRRRSSEQDRLKRELEIAARIQTSILPHEIQVPSLELAARMVPADEVGGDYYDVLPVEGGAYIGVGDVAGHGVPAGMVMLMIQSAVAALCRLEPGAGPARHVIHLNALLHDNIRNRLRQDEHVTFSLLRFEQDGTLRYAGAHEEILVWRRATGRVESFATPGMWLGAVTDVARFTVESRIALEDGDVVLLHSDGVTEARNAAHEEFGSERLHDLFARVAQKPVQDAIEAMFEELHAWCEKPADDATLLLFRYRRSASQSAVQPPRSLE